MDIKEQAVAPCDEAASSGPSAVLLSRYPWLVDHLSKGMQAKGSLDGASDDEDSGDVASEEGYSGAPPQLDDEALEACSQELYQKTEQSGCKQGMQTKLIFVLPSQEVLG